MYLSWNQKRWEFTSTSCGEHAYIYAGTNAAKPDDVSWWREWNSASWVQNSKIVVQCEYTFAHLKRKELVILHKSVLYFKDSGIMILVFILMQVEMNLRQQTTVTRVNTFIICISFAKTTVKLIAVSLKQIHINVYVLIVF